MKKYIVLLNFIIYMQCHTKAQILNVSITNNQSVTCNGMCDGSVTATATGGTGNYSFSWSNGSTNNNISNLCAGSYSVVVNDGATQDTAYATVIQPSQLTINLNSPTPICPGGTVSICSNMSGGTPPYTYSWAPMTGINISTGSCPVFSGTVTTSYTLTVVDANGCVATGNVSAIVNNVNAVATNTGPYCSGANIQLFATGGGSYIWSGPNGFTSNLSNPAALNSTTAMSGIYTVTVTSVNGCTSTATTSVIVNSLPTALPFVNNSNCSGTNLILYANAQGAVAYNWIGPNNFNSTSQNPIIYNAQLFNSGTYTLNITSNFACTSTSTLSVMVSPSPTLTINSLTEPSCNSSNGSLIINASGGTIPFFYSGNLCGVGNFGPTVNPSFSNICSGQANLVVTDANGCVDSLVTGIADSCDLIWPGDANDDLIVDNLDALEIGLGNGISGNARTNTGINWNGYASYPWGSTTNGISDDKHIDCDGNGIIDLADTNAIVLNYGLSRPASRFGKTNEIKTSGGNPILKIDIVQDTITAGGIGNIKLTLGDSIYPTINFYGIAFTLNFDTSIVDPASFRINSNGSWAGNSSNLFAIVLNDGINGFVKSAVSRYNHSSVNGFGLLSNLGFQTKSSYNGTQQLNISISDIKLIDNANQVISVNSINDSTVALNPTLEIHSQNKFQTRIYPNPFSENINFETDKIDNHTITIVDITGKILLLQEIYGNKFTLNCKEICEGIYFYQITKENELITKGKIIKK